MHTIVKKALFAALLCPVANAAARNGPKLAKAEAGEAVNTSTSSTGVPIDAHNTDIDSFAKILARNRYCP
jgi:hypothetical protein